ncbi:hypothetical protein HK103_006886 [Boothiomyces macroporosus]|uniref:chitin synthase n=1 Tax=Boothiomyces macroporosus TaxID=261099 RepID=A0AAD5UD72_9FUNG|nr:hypothetical protein HK103_006886 [Boothiomyces macroporosus]
MASKRPDIFAPPDTLERKANSLERGKGSLFRRKTLGKTLNRKNTAVSHHKKMFEKPPERPSTWVLFSWIITCCCPSPILSGCGILKNSQQAWREKIALCFIAFIMMVFTIFFLIFFSNVVCPNPDNSIPLHSFGGVVIFGKLYNAQLMNPPFNTLFEQLDSTFAGYDVSDVFQRPPIAACNKNTVAQYAFAKLLSPCEPNDCISLNNLVTQQGLRLYDTLHGSNNQTIKYNPQPSFQWDDIIKRNLVVVDSNILDFNSYLTAYPVPLANDPVDAFIRKAQTMNDATHLLSNSKTITKDLKDCLTQRYYVGVLATLPMQCILTRLFSWGVSALILTIMFSKFTMALIFSWFDSRKLAKDPAPDMIVNRYENIRAAKPLLYEEHTVMQTSITNGTQRGLAYSMKQPGSYSPAPHPADLFTVMLVTCYSEGEQSLRGTLDSLAATDYDDSKKLLFVIADGLVQGSGNPTTTPNMLISMMNHDARFGMQPQAQSYVAVATGSKQHNMAQVYCGTYDYQGRAVPMILVVKCGTPDEANGPKPGNRGKRDSQLILMNFFSRVTLNDRMTPLDYDIFRKIHHITGVTPDFYETVLMVDADTMVDKMSLRYLINALHNDHQIIGLCGETRIANKKDSWVTMIQVFEYFISHQMGKAFESLFGGVTCLPGCFCMWRIKANAKDEMIIPILGNPDIIEQYSTNEVYNLHQKNLLLLGEDRFLTTSMLKQFPNKHVVYVPQAFCKTVVPDDFKTLLSQRRRWINSTVHNLMELVMVDALCGTFCFSMQFVVLMDLLSTAVLPAGLLATYYLIFSAIFQTQYSTDNITGILTTTVMAIVIFLPAFIVLFTGKKLSYVLWMFLYLLALPIWQFVFPLYSFWNFDDFSWGETRKVSGEERTKTGHGHEDDGAFASSLVSFKRWDEYEREWRKTLGPLTVDDSKSAVSMAVSE